MNYDDERANRITMLCIKLAILIASIMFVTALILIITTI